MQLQPGYWVLLMNDMRSSNIENYSPVCCAATREELVAFYESQKIDPYSDGKWGKSFKQGGPLEWYNPLDEEWNGYGFPGLLQWFPSEPPYVTHVSNLQ